MKLAVLAALALVSLQHPFASKKIQPVVLKDVKLIDGTLGPPFEHASIVLQDDKIVRVVVDNSSGKWPSTARILDLHGKCVIPGIINAHGHLGLTAGTSVNSDNANEENIAHQLAQYERYGITTVMSLGMNQDLLYQLRSKQEKGKLPGATILTADRGLGVPGGAPAVGLKEDPVYRPTTAEEARTDVRQMARRHPDLIKIWVDDNLHKLPAPKPEVYTAAIEEAHKLGLRVAAHVYYLADAKKLLASHVDILAHSIRDQPVDNKTAQTIVAQHVWYIPTLQLEDAFFIYSDHPKWMNTPFFEGALNPDLAAMLRSKAYKDKVDSDPVTEVHRHALEVAMKNLSTLIDAGAKIGFGTDSGANPYRIQGFAEHRELELMVQTGMTPVEAIRAATGSNAKLLGIAATTGTIETGKQADLLVLDGDPMDSIRHTRDIRMIFHEGREIQPAPLQ